MPSDAAGGVEDSAIRGNAKPLQDGMEVPRLSAPGGRRVLGDRAGPLRMAEEQVFGPVDSGHWLAMWLAFVGGVVGPPAASLRLLERLYDSLRILVADPRRQSAHVRRPVDLIIRLGTDLVCRCIGRHEDEHDFRRVLFQESDEAPDSCGPAGGDRLHKEQDRTASRDDGGLVFRRAARGIVYPELEGAMLVRQSLAVHLRADRRLEVRPACMAGTRGHRPAPSIASTIARANTEERSSLVPGPERARSYVTTFDPP